MSKMSSGSPKKVFKFKIFLHNVVEMIKDVRPSYAVIAFLLAATLWYGVTVRDKVESWVDVRVVFKGAPANLVIKDGLINRVSVRIRAARGLSRGLSGREETAVIDLSTLVKGSNTLVLNRDMLPFNSAYEVVEVAPSRILIDTDTVATREVALGADFDGKLDSDLFVKSMSLDPQKVTVTGAESYVSGISGINLLVPLQAGMRPGVSSRSMAVPVPSFVSVAPAQVKVSLEIGAKTKQVKLDLPVTAVGYKDGFNIELKQTKVTVVAEIPESLAKDSKALAAMLSATVSIPPDAKEEVFSLPVAVALPENAQLVSVSPVELELRMSAK